MQLKSKKPISQHLALAICSLVSATAHAQDDNNISVDLGGVYYQEGSGRVGAKELLVHAKKVNEDESAFSLNITFDALSGGSPNGALASKQSQTFTTPSGNTLSKTAQVTKPTTQTCTTPSGRSYVCGTSGGSSSSHNSIYDVKPGELPLSEFRDERKALSLSWTQPVASATKLNIGGAFSTETDFRSLSANLGLLQDLNQKNTTLSASVNYESDKINPTGGTPVPWTQYDLFYRQGDQSKTVKTYVLGLTQIMNRRWLTQLNFSKDNSDGYQTDPYKVVSVLTANGDNATDTDAANVTRKKYLYENRPMQRSRQAIYWGNKIALDQDTIDFSYRYMSDDWSIVSHTAEIHYRYELGGGHYLEPSYRWYHQTSADFYKLYLLQNDNLSYVSADPRLGEFTATTFGFKYGYVMDRDTEFAVRAESYTQKNVINQPVLTNLQGLDLAPDLKAIIVQLDIQFKY